MGNRNIIISPCGNRSTLFDSLWLNGPELKEFDLCLLFYDDVINDPSRYKKADYFFHLKDFKFYMIYDLLKNQAPHLLDTYEYFYFPDDDVAISTADINKMFTLSQLFDTWISQASLSANSFTSWPILKTQTDCLVRYMGQIEVMAPLFTRYALIKCLPVFTANRSSWGLDSVWSKLLGYPQNKIAVFDAVVMEHTQPVGKGDMYKKLQIDPYIEWKQVTEQFNAISNNFFEQGRVVYIGKHTNQLLFKIVQMRFITKKVIRETKRGNLFHAIYSHFRNKSRRQKSK